MSTAQRTATLSVNADRNVAMHRCTADDAAFAFIVVRDRIVLRCAVIPDGDIALIPAPAHGVLEARNVIVEELFQAVRIALRQAHEALHEMTEYEAAFTGLRMHANHRMLGLIHRRR